MVNASYYINPQLNTKARSTGEKATMDLLEEAQRQQKVSLEAQRVANKQTQQQQQQRREKGLPREDTATGQPELAVQHNGRQRNGQSSHL